MKIGKEILTFENIEIEKSKFYHHKASVFLKMYILRKKALNTLLVTCIMIIKLSHYI